MFPRFARRFFNKAAKVVQTFPEEPLGLSVAELAGFYAPSLTSTLNEMYTLIGKLGWGIHSSVWLARDIRQQHIHQRYVAAKILSTHASEVQGKLAHELDVLRRINKNDAKTYPGRKHVATLLDDFTIADHHGPHLCLVFEALGDFKGSVYPSGTRLPLAAIKSIARQLLLALDFLHRDRKIVHTDLKPENLLLSLPDAEQVIQRYLAEVSTLESSTSAGAMSGSSIPVVLSHPLIPFGPGDTVSANFEIQLADFGTAAMVDGQHADTIQPVALRAPEVIIGTGWGTSVDIWSLGWLLFEFLTGAWLFQPLGGATWSPEAFHLAHMPGVTGDEFDLSYIRQGKNFERYFTPEGLMNLKVRGVADLDSALTSYNVLDDVEKQRFVEFVRPMLRLKPSDRPTAAELLKHEWIKA
ncbi:kinase-like protein [Pholiota conissans]|uniref:non-specific serine/threonine protein kinase n=1 Tax=Pholiota conissans TaxID=109636 RepID=A0A9P6CND1_9AGAR|nr:kinase-like protein [Pholiota conissans]